MKDREQPGGERVPAPRRDGQRGKNTPRVRFIRDLLSSCYLQTSFCKMLYYSG